ncbi:MAG: HD domain-containing protein, partial [Mariprofundaceae bacterium]|nr:HD domain-containing protein [Mariprofundaceae bacterium]
MLFIVLPMNILYDALPASVLKLCHHIKHCGGHAWLVGGALRDVLLGRAIHDIDLEVFGLDFTTLHDALLPLGRCDCVGRQFGVMKLQYHGRCIDIALPRREVKIASGHRGFSVEADPQLAPEQAVLRRDFTINAMMYDPLNAVFLDLHHGRDDLNQGCLRHVSDAFVEDPLRPLRAMQFAARYRMHLHPSTATLCRSMLHEANALPRERLWQEWRKWSLADAPSYGLQALHDSGWLAHYPQLQAMQGCAQEPRWHPEGDVWTHTSLVVDQMAAIAQQRGLPEEEQSILCFAALLHDIAKPLTSFADPQGHIRSPGHAQAAEPLIAQFFSSIGAPSRLLRPVWHLVNDHLTHLHAQPTARAIRRLSARLSPVSLQQWEMLVQADASGRTPHPPSRPALPWLEQAQAMNIADTRPTPWVTGAMLIALGMKPSPAMGQLIHQAYEAQLDGGFDSPEAAQ